MRRALDSRRRKIEMKTTRNEYEMLWPRKIISYYERNRQEEGSRENRGKRHRHRKGEHDKEERITNESKLGTA